jgi:hypothetical protein
LPLLGGFQLTAPLIALELYEISRLHEVGARVHVFLILTALRRNPLHLALMGALLLFLLRAWF